MKLDLISLLPLLAYLLQGAKVRMLIIWLEKLALDQFFTSPTSPSPCMNSLRTASKRFDDVLYACSEVAIVSSRASVMIYDDQSKKWVPSGNTQGLSKVQIYQHTANNTFRVVGRKLQDHEVGVSSCLPWCQS
jgi:hypothetical protein